MGDDNGYEEPPYTTVYKTKGYSERVYDGVAWVCANQTEEVDMDNDNNNWGMKMMWEVLEMMGWSDGGSNKMFMKLFNYITGNNNEKENIQMTIPVRVLMEKDFLNKQMCFYIPKTHQKNPPRPVDDSVYIENTPDMTVFVHTFGGYYVRDQAWAKEAAIFADKLKDLPGVDFSHFYALNYDEPTKIWGRRNEVMFRVTGKI